MFAVAALVGAQLDPGKIVFTGIAKRLRSPCATELGRDPYLVDLGSLIQP